MRVKLDEILGTAGAGFLKAAGVDVATVSEQHLTSSPDGDLANICAAEGRFPSGHAWLHGPRARSVARVPARMSNIGINGYGHVPWAPEAIRTMNVSLTPELEQLVNEKVKSGFYQTASEVVREALRLLHERDQEREMLRADIQAGFDQLTRGQGRTYDKATGRALAERIKTEGRAVRSKKR